MSDTTRESLGSRLGFLLITAGCAIGLGNIWRFPYVTGKYGGACFVVFYLFFLAVMGLPLMVMELAIGRAGRRTLFGAAKVLTHSHPGCWQIPAGIFCAGCAVLMIFYTTVTGWMLCYAFDYIFGGLSAMDTAAIVDHFGELTTSPKKNVLFMCITVVAGSAICGFGLKNGVERVSKVLMSGLFVLLLVLCCRALFLPGAKEGLKFYLMPSMDAVRETGLSEVLVAAMGQAFFTLSLGVGSITIFGSYISREHSLLKESLIIILLDTAVAVLSGIVIFPACMSYGIDVSAGPQLVFLSLPDVFQPHGLAASLGRGLLPLHERRGVHHGRGGFRKPDRVHDRRTALLPSGSRPDERGRHRPLLPALRPRVQSAERHPPARRRLHFP